MAECNKYRDMISCYADGELSGNDKKELERHLKTCASCRSLLSLYLKIAEASAESFVEPPDTFADSIMSKIKALPEEQKTVKDEVNKPRRSLKPVVISFIAAAACLALAFIASPGLFGLMGARNSTASVPMASAAPAPAYNAALQEDTAEYSSFDAVLKAEGAEDANDEAADAQPAASGAGTATQAPLMAETSVMPSTAPGKAPQVEMTGRNTADELRTYYAIFIIEGQLPDGVDEKSKTDNSDGSFNIEISVETANHLLEAGFLAEMGAQESVIALIKYTPQS